MGDILDVARESGQEHVQVNRGGTTVWSVGSLPHFNFDFIIIFVGYIGSCSLLKETE